MERIRTYVINLNESADRREYMKELLSGYGILDVVFIEAVNGKSMTMEELERSFDQNEAFKIYGRVLRGGEVGCALSHLKCAQALLDSKEDVAIVVEDDLVLQEQDLDSVLEASRDLLAASGPAIVLFSGDYWFWGKRKFVGKYKLATVREAVCAQAYMINRPAAELLLSMKRSHLADDWFSIKQAGINLRALYPHIADQNRLEFETDISPEYTGFIRENLRLGRRAHSYIRAVIKRFLKGAGHFEYKKFRW
ncbi:MAG: glycosyltransferase family 25 protein [Bacteroidales bacterium]|nr:glycosyltransferase family 25 protein [Bacteroidales bacterium]